MSSNLTITNEPYTQVVRAKVVALAKGMLDDSIPFLEGVRQLSLLRFEAGVDERDPDFMIFVAIASETDALPIGQVRARWSREALEKLQPEIDTLTTWARNIGVSACESLIRRFHV